MKFKLFARMKKETPKNIRRLRPHPPKETPLEQTVHQNQTSLPAATIPFNEVSTMIQNGLSEAEIIQHLKEEGYEFNQIDEALNRVLKTTVTGDAPLADAEAPPQNNAQPPADIHNPQTFGHDFQAQGEFGSKDEDFSPMNAQPQNSTEMEKEMQEIEEYNQRMEELEKTVNALVNEKVGRIDELKKNLELGLQTITKEVQIIKQEMNAELTKTEDFEEKEAEDVTSITEKLSDLEPRIKAIEKAFKDIVPNLVENVRDIRELLSEKDELPEESFIRKQTQAHKEKELPKNISKKEIKKEHKKQEPKKDDFVATEKDLFDLPQ
ncbi:MAG: hypothetical protein KAI53_02915 [Candidatus Aenigmarchaeota archaeon]|nr:hypothetical protein [Candidatus Aenigmarchaeota archaeon]